MDLTNLSVEQLKSELEKRELSSAGNKEALLGRLRDNNQVQVDDNPWRAAGLANNGGYASYEDTNPNGAEWEAFHHVPESWLPIPLFLVRNVPIKAGVTEADVKEAIERADHNLKVRSVYFDERPKEAMINRRTAFVRLKALRPLKSQPEPPKPADILSPAVLKAINDGPENAEIKESKKKQAVAKIVPPTDGNATEFAQWAVIKLKSQNPPVLVGGEKVQFETGSPQVQLYIGNLSPDWQQDQAFEKAMATYGAIERVFIVRNSRGLSKGYGFVEYQLPGPALRCKQAMDEIERDMRPDPRAMKASNSDRKTTDKGKITEAQKAAGWQEGGGVVVKLLRAEWALIHIVDVVFSRVLYVANLRTDLPSKEAGIINLKRPDLQSPGSQKQLKDLFSQYGDVHEVSVPKNKQTNTTKGFAFVLFTSGLAADRAFRALEKSGTAEIGGALVSFANAAKHTEARNANPPPAGSGKPQPPPIKAPQAPAPPRPDAMLARGSAGRFGAPVPARGPTYAAGRGYGRGRVPGMVSGPMAPPLGPGMGPAMASEMGLPLPLVDPIQQRLQLQNELQAAAAQSAMQQEQMRLQAQAQASQMQAQFQAQMQQQQQQMMAMQEQLAASQRQIQEVQAKAEAEAEARQKLEAEARQAAAALAAKPPSSRVPGGYSSAREEASASRRQGGAYPGYPVKSEYGAQTGAGFGEESGYGLSTGTGQGYGGGPGSHHGQPPAPASAYDGYGEGSGYAAHDYDGYEGRGTAGEAGYESRYAEKYGSLSGYGGYETGYGGSLETAQGAQGGSSAFGGGMEYGAEYGQSTQGSRRGHGSSHNQGVGGSGYGGSSTSSKRGNPSYQGTYGGYGGSYGSHGDPSKRQRY